MRDHSRKASGTQAIIDEIGYTREQLTGRGGLALFVRYVRGIELLPHLERLFGTIRRNRKGARVEELFKQLICYFVDGASGHVSRFDEVRRDRGYAASIETPASQMISSHTVKRFLRKIWWKRMWLFRRLQQKLFLWRLHVEQPDVLILGLDAVVFDNRYALVRHGVRKTYKRIRGFQPLLMTWRGYVIDGILRGGNKPGNQEEIAQKMVGHVVGEIRRHYRRDVPIIVRIDAGFFDQKLYDYLEELGVGYTGTGKLFETLKMYIGSVDPGSFVRYDNGKQEWEYVEFGDRRASWDQFRRAFYLKPRYDDEQVLLEFARPEIVMYTNIGMGEEIDEQLKGAGHEELLCPGHLIEVHHGRGCDELVFRAFKEFGDERLPFKRFHMNAAYFHIMLVSFFLLEAFKHDVGSVVIPVTAYASTVRRKLIDFAAKIVKHSRKIILRVTHATAQEIKLEELWRLSGHPPKFTW